MNFLGYLLLILGVAFFGFELVGLIRDIKKRKEKKKLDKSKTEETKN